MKITQLMLSRGFGGAERYFVDLSIALSEEGHDIQVVCHNKFRAIDQLKRHDQIKIDTVSARGWWDILSWRTLHKIILKFNPDIVQAHLARGAYMAGKVCSRINKPLIVKTHNYVNLKYYKNVDRFITTTNDQREYLIKQGVYTSRIDVIPNFSSITPVEKPGLMNNRMLSIAAYGRLVKKKGMHVLLHAFRQFLEAGNKAVLHIGGDGPERKRLEALVETLGLTHEVMFHGWINDVDAFITQSDVMVLPSLDEPFGIVVLETIALGKPLIATRTKGPLQILDEETAYLVEPGDVCELSEALCRAVDDKESRMKKAEQALDLFKNQYAKGRVVPMIVESCKQAIRQHKQNTTF